MQTESETHVFPEPETGEEGGRDLSAFRQNPARASRTWPSASEASASSTSCERQPAAELDDSGGRRTREAQQLAEVHWPLARRRRWASLQV